MTLTLHDIGVWDTGERIDLVIPSVDAARGFGPGVPFDAPKDPAGRTGSQASGDAHGDVHVDASGLTLAPGFADPHVHFRDPGQTAKETMSTGARAAAAAGFTRVLVMPNTIPAADGETVDDSTPGGRQVLDSGRSTVLDYLAHYEEDHGALPVRYDLCVAATTGRAGRAASDPALWSGRLRGGAEAGEHPVTAISDDGSAIPDAVLDEVLGNALRARIPVVDHCEHHDSGVMAAGPTSSRLGVEGIDAVTETRIVARDIDAARRTGAHVHLQHVSCAASVDLVRRAREDGVPVTCETAPHYLALCDEDVARYGALARMNPPLRSARDRQAVIAAVADGTVDMLATDHAPHTVEEKSAGLAAAPNGVIGLETAYGVCRRVLVDGGYIDDRRLIELMSLAPNRLLGRASTDVAALLNTCSRCATHRMLDLAHVEHPEDVDLVVLDEHARWRVDPEDFESKARNTPFAGWSLTGRPLATIIGSRLVFSRLDAARRR